MRHKPKSALSYKALILAGGAGTRLWPVSRKNKPKQLLSLDGRLSLLQATYKRLRPVFKNSDIWIATGSNLALSTRRQLPEIKNFSFEPVAKNTAPAIGLAALRIYHSNPDNIIVTINSDHYIRDTREYQRVLKLGGRLIKKYPENILLIGLQTEYPETGYGYIEKGRVVERISKNKLWKVKRFIEKPNISQAKKYNISSKYLWNPAIFIFRAEHMLNLFNKFLPRHFKLLMEIKKNINNDRRVEKIFKKMQSVSIDYAIMEKAKDLMVLPSSFGWTDVGSWQAVHDVLTSENKQVGRGKYVGIDSYNNLIYSTTGKLTATVGLRNSVIVNTDDALLVSTLDKSQGVKQVIKELKRRGLKKYI